MTDKLNKIQNNNIKHINMKLLKRIGSGLIVFYTILDSSSAMQVLFHETRCSIHHSMRMGMVSGQNKRFFSCSPVTLDIKKIDSGDSFPWDKQNLSNAFNQKKPIIWEKTPHEAYQEYMEYAGDEVRNYHLETLKSQKIFDEYGFWTQYFNPLAKEAASSKVHSLNEVDVKEVSADHYWNHLGDIYGKPRLCTKITICNIWANRVIIFPNHVLIPEGQIIINGSYIFTGFGVSERTIVPKIYTNTPIAYVPTIYQHLERPKIAKLLAGPLGVNEITIDGSTFSQEYRYHKKDFEIVHGLYIDVSPWTPLKVCFENSNVMWINVINRFNGHKVTMTINGNVYENCIHRPW